MSGNKPVLKVQTAAARPSVPLPTITIFPPPVFSGDRYPSIIPEDFSGVNIVTGFRGSGKTSWGLKMDHPGNILMLDYEDKGILLAKPLGVGGYFQVMTEVAERLGAKFELQAAYDRTLQIMEAIPKDRFTVLFIDNAQDLQDGGAQLIRNDSSLARKYGVRPENAETGAYGGAIPGVKHLIKNMFHILNGKGIKVIVVSFQLKPAWANKQPLFNQFKMTDVSIWHERSILTLIMVDPMPEHYPVPRALIMKESLSLMKWNEEKKMTQQIRRVPAALPIADPQYLYLYLKEPVNLKEPKPGETVTALEIAPYRPSFSNEQLFLLERMARAQKELGLGGEESNE